jgi:hypothetical protein
MVVVKLDVEDHNLLLRLVRALEKLVSYGES